MSVLSVAPISYENSITKKELPLNIFQGKFPIAIKREVSIRIYTYRGTIIPLLCSYWGGAQGHSPTYEQAHVGLDLLPLVSYIIALSINY